MTPRCPAGAGAVPGLAGPIVKVDGAWRRLALGAVVSHINLSTWYGVPCHE